MHLCYMDESGTSSVPGNTSHFVLAGLAVPIWHWTDCDSELDAIKKRYDLENNEIHTAWIMREYREQSRIKDFESLRPDQRRYEVRKSRNAHLLKLQSKSNTKSYRQTKKTYAKSDAYIHLTHQQRRKFISEVADCVSNWGFARLFAECIDKLYFDPNRSRRSIDEQAFEQIVSRFERYLEAIGSNDDGSHYGLLIHDNNETVAAKHTALMKQFRSHGHPLDSSKTHR